MAAATWIPLGFVFIFLSALSAGLYVFQDARARGLPVALWTGLAAVLPLAGFLAYLLKGRAGTQTPQRPSGAPSPGKLLRLYALSLFGAAVCLVMALTASG